MEKSQRTQAGHSVWRWKDTGRKMHAPNRHPSRYRSGKSARPRIAKASPIKPSTSPALDLGASRSSMCGNADTRRIGHQCDFSVTKVSRYNNLTVESMTVNRMPIPPANSFKSERRTSQIDRGWARIALAKLQQFQPVFPRSLVLPVPDSARLH